MAAPRTGRPNGRPPKPIESHRRNGNPSKLNLPVEPMSSSALALVDLSVVPSVPEGFGLVGTSYWKVLWTGGRRHLSELHDTPLMTRLCKNFDKIAELELWLGKDVERRWYTSPNGQVVTHPAVKQIEQMDAQNTAWMSLMGFTPSDRARLGLQEIRVANELDQYRQRKSSVVNAEIVQEV